MAEQSKPEKYLSLAEFAARVHLSRNTIKMYDLPPADSVTGRVRGWKPETIDAWNTERLANQQRKRRQKDAD